MNTAHLLELRGGPYDGACDWRLDDEESVGYPDAGCVHIYCRQEVFEDDQTRVVLKFENTINLPSKVTEMSLDVYLVIDVDVGGSEPKRIKLFSANITHNLNKMADAAGLYECLWRPEETEIKTASQLIEPLKAGIEQLKSDPDKFKAFNAENGWGTYEDFVPWCERYFEACQEFPKAKIEVSR
jgi:hypothetical protein